MTTRTRLTGLAVAAFAVAFLGACASGGSSVLSSTSLTQEDLATSNYATVYDLLRAHSRARIVSVSGQEFLTVYNRGGNIRSGEVSGGNFDPTAGPGGDPGSGAPAISGTGPAEGGGEALLIIDDKQFQGNVTAYLQQIELDQVAELKILRPSETSARYGGDGRVGAVVITMKGSGSSGN